MATFFQWFEAAAWLELIKFMADRIAIFVVGAMRSGTTYLGRLLDAHSQIRLTQEFALFHQRAIYPFNAM